MLITKPADLIKVARAARNVQTPLFVQVDGDSIDFMVHRRDWSGLANLIGQYDRIAALLREVPDLTVHDKLVTSELTRDEREAITLSVLATEPIIYIADSYLDFPPKVVNRAIIVRVKLPLEAIEYVLKAEA